MLVYRCNALYQNYGENPPPHGDYLVGYECGDPVFPSVGVDEDAFLPPQCSGSSPGSDGLLEGLIQKPGS